MKVMLHFLPLYFDYLCDIIFIWKNLFGNLWAEENLNLSRDYLTLLCDEIEFSEWILIYFISRRDVNLVEKQFNFYGSQTSLSECIY